MDRNKNTFAAALRVVRRAKGISQEALGGLSSRTYVSSLERGLKTPTLSKVDQLAEMLEVHPLTMLILSYAGSTREADIARVWKRVECELHELRESIAVKP